MELEKIRHAKRNICVNCAATSFDFCTGHRRRRRIAQYICSLSPLLDLHLPSNSSYIVSVQFEQEASHSNESDSEVSSLLANPSEGRASLAVAVGDAGHHQGDQRKGDCNFYSCPSVKGTEETLLL